jgi:hypothetical protein
MDRDRQDRTQTHTHTHTHTHTCLDELSSSADYCLHHRCAQKSYLIGECGAPIDQVPEIGCVRGDVRAWKSLELEPASRSRHLVGEF